jgi:hypothetical protein
VIEINSIIDQAEKEVREEISKKAVTALKSKLRDLASAKNVVANIEREIEDLKTSIGDGSFVV